MAVTWKKLAYAADVASDPLTTRGDVARRGASVTERLPLGTAGHVISSDGTDAIWRASSRYFAAVHG